MQTTIIYLSLFLLSKQIHSFSPGRLSMFRRFSVLSSRQFLIRSAAVVSATTPPTTTTSLNMSSRPTTGWNHNQPKKWQTTDTEDSQQNSEEKKKTEMRTGWLHNTEAPVTAGSEAKQQEGETEAQRRIRLAKERQSKNHRMISLPVFHFSESKKIVVTEHKVSVPLKHSSEEEEKEGEGEKIDVYFSIVEQIQSEADELFFRNLIQETSGIKKANDYIKFSQMKDASKMILYLQGGPGFGAPTPVSGLGLGSQSSSWAGQALGSGEFDKVVLMDQRGTGKSTPITKQRLQLLFPDLFALDHETPGEFEEYDPDSCSKSVDSCKQYESFSVFSHTLDTAIDYLSCFRANSIVRDAEIVKDALLMENDGTPKPWGGAIGQSFGGFCMMSYLSLIPNPPKICLLTGGIAPMLTKPYDLYSSLLERVKERNLQYYEIFPGDIPVVKRIVYNLLSQKIYLPSGGRLTARRFLQLGMALGGSPSAFTSLHTLLNSAYLETEGDQNDPCTFSRTFLKAMDSEQPFDDNPIYFLLHESIYADGDSSQRYGGPTQWAAHRALEDITRTPSDFSYDLTCTLKSDARPTLFFGEMVFPWMSDGDYAEVSGLGMKALAHGIANKDDWDHLYDADHMRSVLSSGKSKAAAAVYVDDMYVDFDACMKVAKQRGSPMYGCKMYITNEYQHSGLRDDGASIFKKLMGMAKGTIRVPS